MNPQFDQMEPVDPTIRAHLARRSAGRVPDGLLGDVAAALDAERRPHAARLPSLRWTAPRLAGGALAVALVAILTVAIAMPILRSAPAAPGAGVPAGYPAERALTSAELSAIMAGPALPINTTLIAAVTIQARYDVCPMNRYPTLGIVEGMSSQLCVMGANLAVQLGGIWSLAPNSSGLPSGEASGTYAFRYLAPGYLGYLGEIAPASSSRIAFHVSDEWPQPQGGDTFLVSGYMTQLRLPPSDVAFCSITSPEPAGDPLDPTATDPCVNTWLNDAPSPVPTRAAEGIEFPKEAKAVDAAGEALIDGIPGGVAVSGVFVVRQYNGPAAGDSLSCSNPGCQMYRVLAKVADISIPEARPSASATSSAPDAPASPVSSPSASYAAAPTGLIGPNNTPLTSAALTSLMAADPDHLAGRYVVDLRDTCAGDVCGQGQSRMAAFADIVQPDGSLQPADTISLLDVRADGGLVWTIPQTITPSSEWDTKHVFILDATIFRIGDTTMLSSDTSTEWSAQPGAFNRFAPPTQASAGHGLFLVRKNDLYSQCTRPADSSAAVCTPTVEILARLEPVTLP
jgi:hypothetical protein